MTVYEVRVHRRNSLGFTESFIMQRYCVNQGAAIKTLQQIRVEQPHIAEKLADIRQNDASVRNLDLSSFLLEPSESHKKGRFASASR